MTDKHWISDVLRRNPTFVQASSLDPVHVVAAGELDKIHGALRRIAVGNGIYGEQAMEYKKIAREALGMDWPPIEDQS